MEFDYKVKTIKQLKNWYNSKVKSEKSDFLNFEEFLIWYESQEKVCHYCGIKEEEIQMIVSSGKLKSKRFPENGNIQRGRSRGFWLEIDRSNSFEKYSIKNCVLSCYFCNNDKSDVFDGETYKEFQNNRMDFLKKLMLSNN